MTHLSLEERARLYGEERSVAIDFSARYGFGTDGTVWRTAHPTDATAVKVFENVENYYRERNCYQRLSERGIQKIDECRIPSFRGYSDELLIVEMGVVSVPYILDFGKAYLDCKPPFDADQLASWHEELREIWGKKHYKRVMSILAQLQAVGICNLDAKPGNICFADWNDDQEV